MKNGWFPTGKTQDQMYFTQCYSHFVVVVFTVYTCEHYIIQYEPPGVKPDQTGP